MEARARVTSKGQVTLPVQVRRSLGIDEGDVLVFELAGSYATMRKRRPTLDVAAEVRARYLADTVPREITDREAVEEYFGTEHEDRSGDELYVSRGDGTFADSADPDDVDADDFPC